MRGFWKSLPVDYHTYALIALVLLSTVLVLMAKWMSRKQPTMTRKRKKLLLDQQEFVKSVVKAKKVLRVRNTLIRVYNGGKLHFHHFRICLVRANDPKSPAIEAPMTIENVFFFSSDFS